METATQSQTQMLSQIVDHLDEIKLTTLSAKHGLHVVSITDTNMDENVKFIFAQNTCMGFIVTDRFFVKPEFFKGGKFYTIYKETEIKIVVDTYRLKSAEPLNFNSEILKKMDRLNSLYVQADSEVNLNTLEMMNEEAENLATEIQNESATKLFNVINEKYMKVLQASQPSESELKNKLANILDELQNAKEADSISQLMQYAREVLNTLPAGSQEVQAANVLISKMEEAAKSGKTSKVLKPSDTKNIDADKLAKENAEYIDLIKKADQAFITNKLSEAEKLYQKALELKPASNHAKNKLSQIKLAKKDDKKK